MDGTRLTERTLGCGLAAWLHHASKQQLTMTSKILQGSPTHCPLTVPRWGCNAPLTLARVSTRLPGPHRRAARAPLATGQTCRWRAPLHTRRGKRPAAACPSGPGLPAGLHQWHTRIQQQRYKGVRGAPPPGRTAHTMHPVDALPGHTHTHIHIRANKHTHTHWSSTIPSTATAPAVSSPVALL